MARNWFGRKKYGWGWTPKSSEGWLTTLVYVAAVVYIGYGLENGIYTNQQFSVYLLIMSAIFIAIAYRKGPRPMWRWGK